MLRSSCRAKRETKNVNKDAASLQHPHRIAVFSARLLYTFTSLQYDNAVAETTNELEFVRWGGGGEVLKETESFISVTGIK